MSVSTEQLNVSVTQAEIQLESLQYLLQRVESLLGLVLGCSAVLVLLEWHECDLGFKKVAHPWFQLRKTLQCIARE